MSKDDLPLDERCIAAFELGWRMCAQRVKRPDLLSDMDRLAYIKGRRATLVDLFNPDGTKMLSIDWPKAW